MPSIKHILILTMLALILIRRFNVLIKKDSQKMDPWKELERRKLITGALELQFMRSFSENCQ
jgi:hypothetical protein